MPEGLNAARQATAFSVFQQDYAAPPESEEKGGAAPTLQDAFAQLFKKLDDQDKERIKGCQDDIDTLLVFVSRRLPLRSSSWVTKMHDTGRPIIRNRHGVCD